MFFQPIYNSLAISFSMFWEVFWPLTLGFFLSAAVQAVVTQKSLAKLLGKNTIQSHCLAATFGIASSSCSYAAVALARSLFKKGASFTNALIFELSSTNLVIELGIILWVVLGWQFLLGEFLGGAIMLAIVIALYHFTLTKDLISLAKLQSEKGLSGKMEGHAAMDMSISRGSVLSRILSRRGFSAVSHYFVMDWASVWVDILIGFLIAGALANFIPNSLWDIFFFKNNPTIAAIEGPLVGPFIAIISFVCSIGNIPLAAVLWRGGISFGGVISFIFADLIVLPILDIYRKYYGLKVMAYILITFYLAMAGAGYLVEIIFNLLKITPTNREVALITQGISLNYASILNIVFLILGIVLLLRFIKTGGPRMLKMMS